jgi:hypothetical protein
MPTDKNLDQDHTSDPQPQQEPPRPHGDKLDDEVGRERTGDMTLPAGNEEGTEADVPD